MELIPIFFNAIFFIIYLIFFTSSIEKTFFSENKGIITVIIIVLYILFAPLIYSIFTVGSTTFIFASLTGKIPFKSLVPIIYILCGLYIIIQPLSIFHQIKKLLVVIGSISFLFIFLAIGLLVMNPWWNDQLEQSVGTPMPSVGMFMLICNCFLFLVTIGLYIYKNYRKNEWGIHSAKSN